MDNNVRLRIDFPTLCSRHGIRVAQPGDRHYRGGEWTSLRCPFCTGSEGNHLGFNSTSNTFTCFRCGRHGKFETIALLLGVSTKDVSKIVKEFAINVWDLKEQESEKLREQADEVEEEKDFVLPGVPKLLDAHREYLIDRKFKPVSLYRKWQLRSCGKAGRYAYRIIIPITYKGQPVSFTSRDITKKAQDRYLACPPKEALRHHKHCVYGLDNVPRKTCVVVEGTFGVWRIGEGGVCTLGTGWTQEQGILIAKKCTKSYIFFDPDEKEALMRAEALSNILSSYKGHKSYVIEARGAKGRDTAELTRRELKTVRALL